MYQYNYADQTLVDERVAQFRDQTARFLAGELAEEQYLPLRTTKRSVYPALCTDAPYCHSLRLACQLSATQIG